MNKEFRHIVFLMSSGNLLDIAMTYFAMPDLYHEANYWVREHQFGWPGLITVLLIWQIIYTIPLAYRCFWYKPVIYEMPINNYWQLLNYYSFKQTKTIFFPNRIQLIHFIKSIGNFLGYYWPRYYCLSKTLVIIDNFFQGLVYRNAIAIQRKDGWSTLTLDSKSFFYTHPIGKLILRYTDLNHSQILAFQNTVLLIAFVLVIIFFLKSEMSRYQQQEN